MASTVAAWPMVALGEVLTQYTDYIDSPEMRIYPKLSVKLYGRGVVLDTPADGATLKMQRHQIAKAGQVILSEIWGKKGAIGIVPPEGEGALCTSHFFLFDIRHDMLDPRWLQAIFTANFLQDQLDGEAHGTTGYAAVRPRNLLSATIPLPPLDEQRRIVAHIEALAARIEQARGLRRAALAEAEGLKPLIFAAAYDEASRLANGVQPLSELCRIITDGTHSTPTYTPKGVPFLSVKDITSGTLRFDQAKFITPEEHAFLCKRCRPECGDVLLTKVGTTGFAKAIDTDREFSIFVSLALLKLDKARLTSKYTEYMLNSSRLREYSQAGTRGVGNQNLVLKFIRQFPMPSPSLQEQEGIVAYLDDIMKKFRDLRRLEEDSAAELDALLPSVLDKAFRGEL